MRNHPTRRRATLAIVVWHFYHVAFDPEVYPVNFAFYDGRVSEKLYEEEHGLAYEQLKERERRERERAGEEEQERRREPPGEGLGRKPLEESGD